MAAADYGLPDFRGEALRLANAVGCAVLVPLLGAAAACCFSVLLLGAADQRNCSAQLLTATNQRRRASITPASASTTIASSAGQSPQRT
jgi:hypothetical protein